MCQTLNTIYRLIDTKLNMVIIRLGDILLSAADDNFFRDATRLDNSKELMQAEQKFRLRHWKGIQI